MILSGTRQTSTETTLIVLKRHTAFGELENGRRCLPRWSAMKYDDLLQTIAGIERASQKSAGGTSDG